MAPSIGEKLGSGAPRHRHQVILGLDGEGSHPPLASAKVDDRAAIACSLGHSDRGTAFGICGQWQGAVEQTTRVDVQLCEHFAQVILDGAGADE